MNGLGALQQFLRLCRKQVCSCSQGPLQHYKLERQALVNVVFPPVDTDEWRPSSVQEPQASAPLRTFAFIALLPSFDKGRGGSGFAYCSQH